MSNIAILSGNMHSAYTSSVLNLLLQNDLNVKIIVVKKINNINRLRTEFQRDKFIIFIKFFNKLIVQMLYSRGIKYFKIDGFSRFFFDNFDPKNNVKTLSKKHSIPILEVDDFHSQSTLNAIESLNIDYILFTGGGIIRNSLIDIPRKGIVNCHMGILPKYRGMDCNFWALLNNDYENLGYTTHMINSGVDTGPIIKRYYLNYEVDESLSDFINKIEYSMAKSIVESVILLIDGNTELEKQHISDGIQYFSMHKKLINMIKINL